MIPSRPAFASLYVRIGVGQSFTERRVLWLVRV